MSGLSMWAVVVKILYSSLICIVLAVLLRELYLVWLDDTVYIGKFSVTDQSANTQDNGSDFAKKIIGAQAILSRQLLDYQTRAGDTPTDTTYSLPGSSALALPPEALKGVDITFQNVNLSQIFSALRKSFSAPNEVSGHVTMAPNSVLAAVEWPRAPRPINGGEPLTEFLAPSQTDLQSSANYVACSLLWARAASIKDALANVPRAQFCDFSKALGNLYSLSDKASTAEGLPAADSAAVRKRVAELRSHYGSRNLLPDIYRLRADLLDLLPEQLRTTNELVEAQEDRLRFAMLSPDLKGLSDGDKRFAAQALARPAILLSDGKLVDVQPNWSALLSRRETDIARISQSTGLLLIDDKNPIGTVFIVAPNMAVTTRHIIDFALQPRPGDPKDKPTDQIRASVCFGNGVEECKTVLSVGRVIYRGRSGEPDIALIEILDHDPLLIPPLPVAQAVPKANVAIGKYAYIVGFSFTDPRLPPEFIAKLLGGVSGKKRLMPGRILAFSEGSPSPTFTSDMSTTAGTGGGPLVDLSSGEALGVSLAGVWKGERGKFALAQPIPARILEKIAGRNRGEDIKSEDPAKSSETPQSSSAP